MVVVVVADIVVSLVLVEVVAQAVVAVVAVVVRRVELAVVVVFVVASMTGWRAVANDVRRGALRMTGWRAVTESDWGVDGDVRAARGAARRAARRAAGRIVVVAGCAAAAAAAAALLLLLLLLLPLRRIQSAGPQVRAARHRAPVLFFFACRSRIFLTPGLFVGRLSVWLIRERQRLSVWMRHSRFARH